MEGKLEELEKKLDATRARLEATEQDGATEPEEQTHSRWRVTGYTFAEYTHTEEEGTESSFALGSFNPVLLYEYEDVVLFEGELKFEVSEEGETETELEYAQMDLLVDSLLSEFGGSLLPKTGLTMIAGKFLSPVGQFQERLHPAWINKLPDAPTGFGHGGIQPLSEVGVQFRGGLPVGPARATYAVALGNGPRFGHHGLELEGFGGDNNDDKAVSGRVGLLPIPHVEVGGSFLLAEVTGEEAEDGPVTDGDVDLFGADAAFTKGPWDIRFEYLDATLGSLFSAPGHHAETTERIPETDWSAWYGQAAYRLSGMTSAPFLRKLEPVIRYGELDIDGFEEFEEDAERRLEGGVNYLFTPSLVGKIALADRDFDAAERDDHLELQLQIAYGF